MDKMKVFVLIYIFALGACAAPQSKALRVGMELAYLPFEMKDSQGNPDGISADIAKAFAKYLGRDIIIENTAWAGLIPSLQTGKLDMVISSMTITPERSEIVAFSEPYAQSYLALLVGPQSDVDSITALDQKGKILALKQGTSAHIYAEKYLSNAAVNTFSSESAAMTELIQGKADAFMYDQLTIYRNSLDNPGSKMVSIPAKTSESWGAAFKKENQELAAKFNAFLQEYKAQGGFTELTDKYLKEEKKIFDEKGFYFFF